MSVGNRFVRFALAMGVVGMVSAQIPMSGSVAMADDGYPGGGGHNRQLIQAAVIALVGVGAIEATKGGGGNLPPQGPPDTVAGGGSGSGAVDVSAFDAISANDDLSALAGAATAAGLKDTLKGPGPYTVFAPTNAAFAALSGTSLTDLEKPENQTQLKALLSYHVVTGKYTIAQLKALPGATTPAGASLPTAGTGAITITFSEADNILKANGVPVVQSDIPAANGVIHPIGQVLTAPAPAAQ